MGMLGDGLELIKLANMGANADVHEKLGKFVERTQELQARLETLEESNKQLREQLRFKGSLVRVRGILFADNDDEPLCSRCAEVDRKLVHLLFGSYPPHCPECKTSYLEAERRSALWKGEVATRMEF